MVTSEVKNNILEESLHKFHENESLSLANFYKRYIFTHIILRKPENFADDQGIAVIVYKNGDG